jgi:mannose-1-phosphate guanylyltransferase
MKALLLAAGLGTRLRPLTDVMPKCLVRIKGRPLLDFWLEMLTEAGIGPLLVNLHHLPEQVREYVATSRFRDNVVLVYEHSLLGTGGTILANSVFFSDGPFMVIHADNYSRFDVRAFVECHRARPPGCEITMLTFTTDAPQSCGIVELDNRNVVVGFHEKVAHPPGSLANGAVYIMNCSILQSLRSLNKQVIDISTDVIPANLGRICTYHNDCYHRDIGTCESLSIALKELT